MTGGIFSLIFVVWIIARAVKFFANEVGSGPGGKRPTPPHHQPDGTGEAAVSAQVAQMRQMARELAASGDPTKIGMARDLIRQYAKAAMAAPTPEETARAEGAPTSTMAQLAGMATATHGTSLPPEAARGTDGAPTSTMAQLAGMATATARAPVAARAADTLADGTAWIDPTMPVDLPPPATAPLVAPMDAPPIPLASDLVDPVDPTLAVAAPPSAAPQVAAVAASYGVAATSSLAASIVDATGQRSTQAAVTIAPAAAMPLAARAASRVLEAAEPAEAALPAQAAATSARAAGR